MTEWWKAESEEQIAKGKGLSAGALPTENCKLPTEDCKLFRLPITYHRIPMTLDYELPTED